MGAEWLPQRMGSYIAGRPALATIERPQYGVDPLIQQLLHTKLLVFRKKLYGLF